MKRGKDDEKIMEPMFPRLHVNDTEKGGPRAPPRNKMALYEQLSIPSQRFNAGVLHLNPNNSAGVVPASSSSQEFGHDRGMCFPIHATSTHPAGKTYARNSDFNTPLVQSGQKKKLDEEDFMVPVFVQAGIDQDLNKNSNGVDRDKISPSSPAYLCHSINIQNDSNREPKISNVLGSNMRQEARSQNENPKEFMAVGEQSVKSVKSSLARENIEGPLAKMNAPSGQEHRDHLANSFGRLQSTGASLHHESRATSELHNSACGNDISNEKIRGLENGCSSIRRRDSCLEELGSPNNTTDNIGYHEDKLQTGNGDRGDDASETSMVDSISGLDISPDDVVGIIGQKHFWKARRSIVNQQRVFAVQVFELHRLIKVQRLIAESPNICLEDGAYLGKPLKGSSAKKCPLEYVVKPYPHIVKHKDDSENPSHKMECSAENAVEKTSLSSVQNVSQPSSYRPCSGNPLPPPVVADTISSPCFHQPTGHQWLFPVMSPSEGLIYKPYPGHGFAGPVCGGFGPPVSNPMMGNFMNLGYGVPASHHHYQGIGVSPTPPFGHGYFPPYGMPVISPAISGSAVEQGNNFTCSQPGQLVGGGANFNLQRQSSCNMPTQNNGAIPNVVKPHASKESELQGSTASSPGERAPATVVGQTTEGGNALPLFPTSPAVHASQGAHELHDTTDQPTRVIRVVPHNARSATESVARIFQSIQEERKQHDSV